MIVVKRLQALKPFRKGGYRMGALTDTGFLRPAYDDLLTEQINRAKQLFGEDIDTSELSPLGKYIRLNVYDLAQIYEDLEITYFARFPNTASGQSLDRLCAFVGITRNPATPATHTIKITGTAGTVIEAGFLVGTVDGIEFYLINEATIGEDGTAVAEVECTEAGTIGNVTVGAIDTIVNPVVEVDEIEHISIVTLGEEVETDYNLRTRFTQAQAATGENSSQSITGAVSKVSGVQSVMLIENDANEEVNGLPPHSFEVYVYGGEDEDIAQAIYSKKPIGIRAYGTTSVEVEDEGGTEHTIAFTRAIATLIKAQIKIKTNTLFESNGIEQIKQNIVDYISTLDNGEDIIRSALYGAIYSVAGVIETTELKLSGDGGSTFSETNITLGNTQIARITAEDISVEVVADD